jgi:hypothetical protein
MWNFLGSEGFLFDVVEQDVENPKETITVHLLSHRFMGQSSHGENLGAE